MYLLCTLPLLYQPFPLKNIDDERTKILAAPSTAVYILSDRMPYGAATKGLELPSHDRSTSYTSANSWYSIT